MRLHPQNPTPGVSDMPPAPSKEPVQMKDVLDLCAAILHAQSRAGTSEESRARVAAWDKLDKLRIRL